MLDNNTLLIILAVASTLAGLITETVKSIFGEAIKMRTEVLAAVVSIFSGIFVCVSYIILFDIGVNLKTIVVCIILVLANVIASSAGYDKVVSIFGKITGKIE